MFVRNRMLNHLSWPAEKGSIRRQRRQALCELDGLLSQLEEMNLRGTEVPGRVRVALRRHGAPVSDTDAAAQLIVDTRNAFAVRGLVGPHVEKA